MKLYITRHGQVDVETGDHPFHPDDPPLTEIGQKQAALLGEALHRRGFCGRIYASPYRRAMETAAIVARICGAVLIPWAPIREILRMEPWEPPFSGATLEELCAQYGALVNPAAELAYPWWSPQNETMDDVRARVAAGYAALSLVGDTLFVGHGASAGALNDLLLPGRHGALYNCGLTAIDTQSGAVQLYKSTAHLPPEWITENTKIVGRTE